MVTTIDYAFFPHIFSEIISQCDVKTRNKLRTLCSSIKVEIDKLHCSELTFLIEPNRGSDVDGDLPAHPEHATLEVTPRNDKYNGRVPALCSSHYIGGERLDLTVGIQPEHVFALRNAHTVSTWFYDLMWDAMWAANALETGARYHSFFKLLDRVERLELLMEELSVPAGVSVPAQVAIPSTIQRLELRQQGDDVWMPRSTLLHNCYFLRFAISEEALTLGQEEQENNGEAILRNDFFTSLLRPCVRHLVLLIAYDDDAIAYFNAIKSQELSSRLASGGSRISRNRRLVP